jgi:hypothetical protein
MDRCAESFEPGCHVTVYKRNQKKKLQQNPAQYPPLSMCCCLAHATLHVLQHGLPPCPNQRMRAVLHKCMHCYFLHE